MDSTETQVRAVIAGQDGARSLEGMLDDLDAAYDLRDRVAADLGPTCGWKIALNGPGQVAQLGIPGPLVGRIVGKAALPDGAEIRLSDYTGLALEPELAIVLSQNVEAPVDRGDMPALAASVHVALEVLDRRGLGNVMHPPTFVALNVFNAGVVLGDEVPVDALSGAQARFIWDGTVLLKKPDSAPEHPFDAALHVINQTVGRGLRLLAGDVILCGTHHPPTPVQTPGVASFSVGESAVSLSISP